MTTSKTGADMDDPLLEEQSTASDSWTDLWRKTITLGAKRKRGRAKSEAGCCATTPTVAAH
jgi:hypothetical protein